MPRFPIVLLPLCLIACSHFVQSLQRATAQPKAATITLIAVGDILLDRGVAAEIEEHGLEYPFAHVAPTLQKADIAFGNLECPLSKDGTKVVKPFVFKAKPESAVCLAKAGLDMLSLANNHTLDCGRDGLVETQQYLKAHVAE